MNYPNRANAIIIIVSDIYLLQLTKNYQLDTNQNNEYENEHRLLYIKHVVFMCGSVPNMAPCSLYSTLFLTRDHSAHHRE